MAFRKSRRRELDAYYSPAWAAGELLRFVPDLRGARVLEPCCGDGALVKPLREAGCEVITNDLNPRIEADYHEDARDPRAWRHFPRVDFVVTNPAFSIALEILKNGIAHAEVGCPFFLRLSFLEPTADDAPHLRPRAPFFAAHPINDLIVLPRFSFTGDGKTDSVTCAWMVWYRRRRPQRIEIVTRMRKTHPLFEAAAPAAAEELAR